MTEQLNRHLKRRLFIFSEVVGMLLYVPYYTWASGFDLSRFIRLEAVNLPYSIIEAIAFSAILAFFVQRWEAA